MTATPAPGALPPSVLQPYANARLLLYVHQLPGRFDSPRLGRMVCDAFLKRARMVGESSSGLGIDSGDVLYAGYLCRSALLDPSPTNPWDWLTADITWSEVGFRPPLADGRCCEAPAQGAIWLGSLRDLQSPGVLPPTSRGQLAGLRWAVCIDRLSLCVLASQVQLQGLVEGRSRHEGFSCCNRRRCNVFGMGR